MRSYTYGESSITSSGQLGDRMGTREEYLSAVLARLEQVLATRDLSPVLEPNTLAGARCLAAVLGDNDLQARYVLGLFHL